MSTRGKYALACGVVAFFLVVVFGCAIVDLVAPYPPPKLVGFEKAQQDAREANARFADGSMAKLLEDRMRTTSRVRRTSLAFYSPMLLRLFGEAGNNYVAGPNSVLFLRNRIQVAKNPEVAVNMAAGRIAAIANYLGSLGTHTVAMPIPRKCVVLANELPGRVNPHAEYDHQLIARLRELGVESVDLLQVFAADHGDPAFIAGDSHWSSWGCLLSARATAMQILGGKPLHEPALVYQPSPHHASMIAHALGLDPMAETLLPDIPCKQHYFTTPTEHRVVKHAPKEGRPNLLLTGTSFSTHATGQDAMFPQLLSAMLQSEVWNGARAGVTTLQSLAESLATLNGRPLPETVVLELPNHYSICFDLPLSQIGDVFAQLPISDGYVSLLGDDPDHFCVPQPPPCPLRPGVTVATPQHSIWRIQWGSFVYPRDGTLIAVLGGRVTGAPAQMTADFGASKVYQRWPPSRTEIAIPIAGDRLGHEFDVTVAAPTAGSQVELQSLDVRCNLDLAHGVAAAPGVATAAAEGFRQTLAFPAMPAVGNAFLGIRIDGAAGPQRPVQVDATFTDGTTVRLFGPEPLEPSARLLLPLGSTARALRSIDVAGEGPAPTAPIRAWHLQRRRN